MIGDWNWKCSSLFARIEISTNRDTGCLTVIRVGLSSAPSGITTTWPFTRSTPPSRVTSCDTAAVELIRHWSNSGPELAVCSAALGAVGAGSGPVGSHPDAANARTQARSRTLRRREVMEPVQLGT